MAGWPSAAQRRELGSFPGHAGPEDVDGFFDLSPQDLRWVLFHRGDARLGVAVQLCSLRWLGFVPDQLAELPRPALLALCEQLETDPDDLLVYGVRVQTRSDHFAAVRERAGFRAFDQAQREILGRWLELRAIEHERAKAIWELCCKHLLAERIVRPTVDALVRMIGTARDRSAHHQPRTALSTTSGRPAARARPPAGAARSGRRDLARVVCSRRLMAARRRRSAVRWRSICTWIGCGLARLLCRCCRPGGCGCSRRTPSAGQRGRSPGCQQLAGSRCCWCSSGRCSSSAAMS